ncbi:unnamed protein product [Pseudo-nitzschia multistriata]|uniref:N-acetyltransferase domain-containing protein n=1 Tax=Pseudo-nitzschia multistriata TaxID=183589 RepID=A0A448ZKY6_9STRA|nr:unnamed protein product [Pseudo-nitzschia multistriata]
METTKTSAGDADSSGSGTSVEIGFIDYRDESQLEHVDRLVAVDLSEPYSIFTYRYFLNRYPDLCILAVDKKSGEVCGCVVGKIDVETNTSVATGDHSNVVLDDAESSDLDTSDRKNSAQQLEDCEDPTAGSAANYMVQTGYIGMLAVSKSYRRKGIGKDLVRQVLKRMKARRCTSVTLETEVSNVTAQKLYQDHFGFIREELLVRYYLNCGDAYRLRLWF